MSKAPICSCGIPMKERRNKATGKPFLGCAKFGKGGCGETANADGSSSKFEDNYHPDQDLNQ